MTTLNTQSGEDLRKVVEDAIRHARMNAVMVERYDAKVAEGNILLNVETIMAAVQQRESSLLDEVEKRVVGVRVFNHAACSLDGKSHGESCVAQAKMQSKQAMALQAIRKERGL